MNLARGARTPDGSPQHASAEAWETFVRSYTPDKQYRWELLRSRAHLVASYPDLGAWFAAPLIERVGRPCGASPPSSVRDAASYASYRARLYFVFLNVEGDMRFDWDWLIAVAQLQFRSLFTQAIGEAQLDALLKDAVRLGFHEATTRKTFEWMIHRIVMHTADPRLEHITEGTLQDMMEALTRFAERPDVPLFYGSVEHYQTKLKTYVSYLHRLHVVLYHRGQVKTEPPRRQVDRTHLRIFTIQHKPLMKETLDRYLATRRLTDRLATVRGLENAVRLFIVWLEQTHPAVETFTQVTRPMMLEYLETLNTRVGAVTKRPLTIASKREIIGRLVQFFRELAQWGWEDAPTSAPLLEADIPKLPQRIPRYIPEDQLERLMAALPTLDCPYQQAALLIARWSGARRGEIRRLAVDCLDAYPDGTPRLRIPAGKTYQERLVPIMEEAAEAIRGLQRLRRGERGLLDAPTGEVTRYLFMRRGALLSANYLFSTPLENLCRVAGLVTADGKPTISSHRFRHTVGTQLAERGAKLHTVMKILGHESAAMALVYAQISDKEVLKDYQAVLGPGAIIAGPSAQQLRAGDLSSSTLDWLKANFFKTELELGRCLRLPQEGPCECELYLTCAKFVTTPAYAPRLRRRREREEELIEDARSHGWQREVERHQWTVKRIEQLLAELGEPIEGPAAPE